MHVPFDGNVTARVSASELPDMWTAEVISANTMLSDEVSKIDHSEDKGTRQYVNTKDFRNNLKSSRSRKKKETKTEIYRKHGRGGGGGLDSCGSVLRGKCKLDQFFGHVFAFTRCSAVLR